MNCAKAGKASAATREVWVLRAAGVRASVAFGPSAAAFCAFLAVAALAFAAGRAPLREAAAGARSAT